MDQVKVQSVETNQPKYFQTTVKEQFLKGMLEVTLARDEIKTLLLESAVAAL